LEEEDARIYDDFADGLKENTRAGAKVSRLRLTKTDIGIASSICTKHRFGDHVPHIRRQDVRGFVQRAAVWLVRHRSQGSAKGAETMELKLTVMKRRRAARPTPASANCWATWEEERNHATRETDRETKLSEEESARKAFVRAPGDSARARGLMDGSVSTLAPLFAARSHAQQWATFLWLARSVAASAWGSRRRCPTTAVSPAAGIVGARFVVVYDDDRRHRTHDALFDIECKNATSVAVAVVWSIGCDLVGAAQIMDTPLSSRFCRLFSRRIGFLWES